MKNLILLLLFIPIISKGAPVNSAHPLHFTFITIDLISDKQAIIAIKVFKDDLRTVIQNNYSVSIDLDNNLLTNDANSAVFDYVSKKLLVKNHLKIVKLEPVDIKVRDDAMFIYFKFPVYKNNSLEIEASLLFDLYPDQKNMLIVKSYTEQGFELIEGRNVAQIEFKKP